MDNLSLRSARDRLFGLWAARQLGLEGGDALVYAAAVEEADAAGGDREMIAKVFVDLTREEAPLDIGTIESQLRDCENRARRQPSG